MNEERVPSTRPSDGTSQPPVRLFLKSSQTETPALPPSWLARRMGLHVYSNVLLTKKVRTEMNFAAGLLLLVSLFEWLLWTLLFNGIYSGDILNHGVETILAALTAVFFGVAVFWFERQMLTSSEKGVRLWAAMSFRVVYIVAAALITSQTFELMLFQKPIEMRAREEAIRENAAKHYIEVLEADKRVDEVDSRIQITAGAEEDALEAVQKERQWEESRRNSYLVQLATAQSEDDFAKADQNRRLLRESQDRLNDQREREREAEKALKHRRHEMEERKVEIVRQADALHERFNGWAARLLASKPGDKLADGDWHYLDPQPSFFEQLFLLEDLRKGRPAAWPGATPEVRDALRKLGFYEPPVCPDPEAGPQLASMDDEMQAAQLRDIALDCERRQSNTDVFEKAWWAGLGIAMLIPILILIIKAFLLPEELRFYYSRIHQAELGDVEAFNVTQAEKRLSSATTHGERS